MNRVGGFFNDLQKSTKITLLSCACMVMLTLLLMIFFILFPITPSEKVMSTIGRESSLKNNDPNMMTALPGAVTTSSADSATSTAKVTSTAKYTGTTTTRTNYKIKITTGTGFLYNGRIPTGVRPGGDYETQVAQQDYNYNSTTNYAAPTTGAANAYDPNYIPPATSAGNDQSAVTPDPSVYDPNTGGDSGSSGGDTGYIGGDSGSTGGDTGYIGGDSGSTGGDAGSTGGDTGNTGVDAGAGAAAGGDQSW